MMAVVHRTCYKQFISISPCRPWLNPSPSHTWTCACDKHCKQGQCVAAYCLEAQALGPVPGPHVITGATSYLGLVRGDAVTSTVDGEIEEEEAGDARGELAVITDGPRRIRRQEGGLVLFRLVSPVRGLYLRHTSISR
jgi:hypothetical protein